MADLKGTLEVFAKRLYGEDAVVRFRPTTSPSPSPRPRWTSCASTATARAAALCKGEGWIEILGCGMVHPKVLAQLRHRPGGLQRLRASAWALSASSCGRYQIDDLRLFYENDLRFLTQFN